MDRTTTLSATAYGATALGAIDPVFAGVPGRIKSIARSWFFPDCTQPPKGYIMKPAMSNNIRPLAKATTMRVPDPAGQKITCTRGRVWITLDGILQDFILTAGTPDDTFVTTSDRNALLYALDDSQISITVRSTMAAGVQSSKPQAPIERFAAMHSGVAA